MKAIVSALLLSLLTSASLADDWFAKSVIDPITDEGAYYIGNGELSVRCKNNTYEIMVHFDEDLKMDSVDGVYRFGKRDPISSTFNTSVNGETVFLYDLNKFTYGLLNSSKVAVRVFGVDDKAYTKVVDLTELPKDKVAEAASVCGFEIIPTVSADPTPSKDLLSKDVLDTIERYGPKTIICRKMAFAILNNAPYNKLDAIKDNKYYQQYSTYFEAHRQLCEADENFSMFCGMDDKYLLMDIYGLAADVYGDGYVEMCGQNKIYD